MTNEENRKSWMKQPLEKFPPGSKLLYAGAQELQRIDHVAINYAKDKLSLIEYPALKIVKKMTARFSSKGNDTTELMALGIHIVATKA